MMSASSSNGQPCPSRAARAIPVQFVAVVIVGQNPLPADQRGSEPLRGLNIGSHLAVGVDSVGEELVKLAPQLVAYGNRLPQRRHQPWIVEQLGQFVIVTGVEHGQHHPPDAIGDLVVQQVPDQPPQRGRVQAEVEVAVQVTQRQVRQGFAGCWPATRLPVDAAGPSPRLPRRSPADLPPIAAAASSSCPAVSSWPASMPSSRPLISLGLNRGGGSSGVSGRLVGT